MLRNICLMVGLFISLSSYGEEFRIRHLTTQQGMSQSDVKSIYQDSQGFMWLSTNGGLNCYDGYRVKTIQLTPALKGLTQIYNEIKEDSRGRLWISIVSNFIIYDLNSEKATLFSELYPQIKFDAYINPTVQFDTQGDAWIADKKSLYFLSLDNDNDIFYSVQLPDSQITISELCTDKLGDIWVGTSQGIFKTAANRVIKTASLAVHNFACIGTGFLISSRTGLYYNHITDKGSKVHFLSDLNVNSILPGLDAVYLGTNEGLYAISYGDITSLNAGGLKKIDIGEQISVMSLGQDRSGQIWIGVDNGGVRIYSQGEKRFKHYAYANSNFNNKIRSIHEDASGNLWIGTKGSDIGFIPHFVNGYKQIHTLSLDANQPGAYFITNIGDDIYVASDQLYKINVTFNGNTPTFTQHAIQTTMLSGIMTIAPSPDKKHLWLGTYSKGLFRYCIANGDFEKIDIDLQIPNLKSTFIRNLRFDTKGNLWIATSEGVAVLCATNLSERRYSCTMFRNDPKEVESLSYNYSLPLYFDSADNLWIGSLGGGLSVSKLNDNGMPSSFERYSTTTGLVNNTIKSIEQDSRGIIWVSSNGGLSRIDNRTETLTNYTVDQGLQDYEFGALASCYRKNGEMIFGGVRGINVFRPESIKEDSVAPTIVITELSLFNQVINTGQEIAGRVILPISVSRSSSITLRHNENIFTLTFAALDYVNPGRNKYAYMLEGFDDNWVHTSAANNFARYTNIPPGEYIFKVKSADINTHGDATSIAITIKKPWWRTNIAIVCIVMIFCTLLYIISKTIILIHHNKMKLDFALREKERMTELSDMQVRFFTNISHEFRTPLSLIIAPIRELTTKKNIGRQHTTRLYGLISHNSEILSRLINQLLDFAKSEQGKLEVNLTFDDIVVFAQNTLLQFGEFARQKDISLQFDPHQQSVMTTCDFTMLEHILYNLLSNAIKHSRNGSQVILRVEVEHKSVIISVIDYGEGIPKELQGEIFERFPKIQPSHTHGGTGLGLAYTKNLVELNSGKISFTSEPNQGTTFFVELPILTKKQGTDILADESLQEDVVDTMPEYDDTPQGKSKSKLLIVEDNAQITEYLKVYFDESFIVILAQNGVDGYLSAVENIPDIIITDVMMPKMDGNEMTEKIKTNDTTSHIPIIMLSAKVDMEDYKRSYDIGADMYCPKPFDIDVLNSAVHSLLLNRERLKKLFRSSSNLIPDGLTTSAEDEAFMRQCVEIVKKYLSDKNFTVTLLTQELNTTQYLLNKKLKTITGVTANDFIRNVRLNAAAKMLTETNKTISEVTYLAGFNSLKYFRECFT